MGVKAASVAKDRGREAVEAALIKAACKMLASEGPRGMSVRNVAAIAGVNHGQVHHYFGGKKGLIRAAVHHLAQEHFERANERAGESGIPPALTLAEDSQYLRTVVRLVLDGYLDEAVMEIQEGNSVPRQAIMQVTGASSIDEIPLDVKATFATYFAMELGWAALEPFVMKLAGIKPAEATEARDHAREIARDFSSAGIERAAEIMRINRTGR